VYGKLAETLFEIPPDTQERSFIIIDTKTNEAIYEATSYESLLYRIDFMGIAKSFK
jgi:hypothetical protein